MENFINEYQLKKLKQKNWDRLRKSQKIDLLTDITKNFAEFYHMDINIDIFFIKLLPITGEAGGCSDFNSNHIMLNDTYFNKKYVFVGSYFKKKTYEYTSINIYHVLMHELRHFYQIWVMKHPEINPEFAEKVKNNMYNDKYRTNYINIFCHDAYLWQFVEREAISFELKQIDEHIKLLDPNDDKEEIDILLKEKDNMNKIITDAYKRLQGQLRVDCPIDYIDAAMKAIVKNPKTRFKNDTELGKNLNDFFYYKH